MSLDTVAMVVVSLVCVAIPALGACLVAADLARDLRASHRCLWPVRRSDVVGGVFVTAALGLAAVAAAAQVIAGLR